MEIVALDRGPGIADLSRALQDGYSTGGTPGTGLGAIKRMAEIFDVFSNGKGTAIFARDRAAGDSDATAQIIRGACRAAFPDARREACGDNLAWEITGDRCMVLAVDGLGHGMQAAEAADEAVRVFRAHSSESPASLITRLHDALKKTRGRSGGNSGSAHSGWNFGLCGSGQHFRQHSKPYAGPQPGFTQRHPGTRDVAGCRNSRSNGLKTASW